MQLHKMEENVMEEMRLEDMVKHQRRIVLNHAYKKMMKDAVGILGTVYTNLTLLSTIDLFVSEVLLFFTTFKIQV